MRVLRAAQDDNTILARVGTILVILSERSESKDLHLTRMCVALALRAS